MLESIFSNAILDQVTNSFKESGLISAITNLTREMKNVADQTPKPFIFLKGVTGLSSNVNANVEILSGPQIPQGYKATIKDFNLTFSTAAGTVRLVIMDAQKNIIQPLVPTITANTNGIGETVLESNQRLAVVGESAGAGVFTVYCSGILQKNVTLELN